MKYYRKWKDDGETEEVTLEEATAKLIFAGYCDKNSIKRLLDHGQELRTNFAIYFNEYRKDLL